MSRLRELKEGSREVLSLMDVGAKLTQIGLQTGKTPEEVALYFMNVMKSLTEFEEDESPE